MMGLAGSWKPATIPDHGRKLNRCRGMPPAIRHPEPPSNGRGPPQRPTGLARRADPVSIDPGSTERTFALGRVRTMHGPHSGMRRNARADRVRIRLLRARIRRENGHETAFWHGIRHINERLPEKPQVARIGRADTPRFQPDSVPERGFVAISDAFLCRTKIDIGQSGPPSGAYINLGPTAASVSPGQKRTVSLFPFENGETALAFDQALSSDVGRSAQAEGLCGPKNRRNRRFLSMTVCIMFAGSGRAGRRAPAAASARALPLARRSTPCAPAPASRPLCRAGTAPLLRSGETRGLGRRRCRKGRDPPSSRAVFRRNPPKQRGLSVGPDPTEGAPRRIGIGASPRSPDIEPSSSWPGASEGPPLPTGGSSEALTGPRPSGRPGLCRSWFSGERRTRRNRARRGWRNREERRGKGRHAQSGGAREGLAGSTRMREPRRTRNTQRAARPRRGL